MANTSARYAGFWRRYIAFSFDALLFSLLDIGISYIFHQRPFVDVPPKSVSHLLFNFFWPKALSVGIILASWLWSDGQTFGKWLMRIRIVKEDRTRMDIGTAFLRLCGYVASNVSFNLGYLWMLIDPKKQTWHDKIANTYVVEVDGRRPSVILYIAGFVLPTVCYLAILVWVMVARGLVDSPKDFRAMYDTIRIASAARLMKPEVKAHYEKAQGYIKQANALDPKAADYMKNMRPVVRQAIEEYKLARDLDKKNPFIYNAMGNAFGKLDGDSALNNAEENYETAVRLDTHNSRYTYNWGSSLYKLERYSEAVKVLEDAVSQDDDNAQAYHLLGMTYGRLKNTSLARKNYMLAIAEYRQHNEKGVNDKVIADVEKMMNELK